MVLERDTIITRLYYMSFNCSLIKSIFRTLPCIEFSCTTFDHSNEGKSKALNVLLFIYIAAQLLSFNTQRCRSPILRLRTLYSVVKVFRYKHNMYIYFNSVVHLRAHFIMFSPLNNTRRVYCIIIIVILCALRLLNRQITKLRGFFFSVS